MGENRRGVLENVAVARDLYERAVRIDDEYGEAWKTWIMMKMEAGNWLRMVDLFEILSAVNGEEI